VPYFYHLLLGVVVSFIATIPVGPVNLAVMQAAINSGRIAGYKVAAGSAFSEWIYCLMALMGLSVLLTGDAIKFYIQICSVPILLILGILSLRSEKEIQLGEASKIIEFKNNFLLGVVLNLLNPFLLPFWLGMSTYMRNQDLISGDTLELVFFSVGVYVGTFTTQAILVNLSTYWKNIFDPKVRQLINKIIGVVFIVFGVFMLWQSIPLFIQWQY
jgi:threonine/homoserine/homoserine lactone efflux protein